MHYIRFFYHTLALSFTYNKRDTFYQNIRPERCWFYLFEGQFAWRWGQIQFVTCWWETLRGGSVDYLLHQAKKENLYIMSNDYQYCLLSFFLFATDEDYKCLLILWFFLSQRIEFVFEFMSFTRLFSSYTVIFRKYFHISNTFTPKIKRFWHNNSYRLWWFGLGGVCLVKFEIRTEFWKVTKRSLQIIKNDVHKMSEISIHCTYKYNCFSFTISFFVLFCSI